MYSNECQRVVILYWGAISYLVILSQGFCGFWSLWNSWFWPFSFLSIVCTQKQWIWGLWILKSFWNFQWRVIFSFMKMDKPIIFLLPDFRLVKIWNLCCYRKITSISSVGQSYQNSFCRRRSPPCNADLCRNAFPYCQGHKLNLVLTPFWKPVCETVHGMGRMVGPKEQR